MAALGAVPSFLALYIIQLGGSNLVVGWLTSGPALINLLWLIPCGQIIQRSKSYLYPIAVGIGFQHLSLILLTFIPLLPVAWRPWSVVVLIALSALPTTLWITSYQVACGEMFQPRRMVRLLGRRWAAMNVSNVVLMLLLGKLIDSLPFPLNFQVLFAGAGILTLVSIWFMLRLRLPPREEAEPEVSPRESLARSLKSWLKHYRPFVLFEVGTLAGYFALFAAAPLIRIYWVRDLGATGSWVGALTAALSVGMALGNLLWGRWSQPGRDRRLYLYASLGTMGLYPLLTAACENLTPLVFVVALAGFFAGGDLILFNRMVQVSPRGRRPTFLAIHNTTANVAAFVAPLISAALADNLGTRAVLFGVAALGLIGALLIYLLGWNQAVDTAPAGPPAGQNSDQ